MIDISGRAVRAGIRSITAVATASCFAVMPQVAGSAYAHTGGAAARAHDHATPHRDHDGREVRDQARDQGRDPGRGRADVVVDTRGPRGAIVPGRTYKWPFEVTNRGSVPARDVALTARPDKNLKVLAAPPKCRWRHSGPLVCRIGLLSQGQTRRGEITATVVPRARTGKALSNPIQVSWRNAPNAAQRMSGEFPPVAVSPGADIPAPVADGAVPYPLTVTERGPVTSESVVVRSPIGLPAPEGPCASGIAPAKIAGKAVPIKPAFDSCGAKLDDAAACGCVAPHDRPAADAPVADAAAPDKPAAAAEDRPESPCGAAADRPVVVRDNAVPPCALNKPVGGQDRPGTASSAPPAAVVDRPGAGAPATTPCDASRPVILPAPVPDRPAAPSCAGAQDRPEAEQGKPAAAPAAEVNRPAAAPSPANLDRPSIDKPNLDRPSIDKPAADKAEKPAVQPVQPVQPEQAATPCGAAATAPVLIPSRPAAEPYAPAVPPCAQAWPNACGCQYAQNAPAAPAADNATPAPDTAPCAAEDKPMAVEGEATSEGPTGPSCGASAPAVVHQEPGVAPVTVAPMTPQAGLGKAAHRPLGRPRLHAGIPVHAPRASGRAHRDCVRQGTGFVCPLGAAPGRRPHLVNLTAPGHPHTLHCAGAAGAACHVRRAQPVAMRPQSAGGRLPTTGASSALLALSGVGLAGAGMVLYRLSRSRRGDES